MLDSFSTFAPSVQFQSWRLRTVLGNTEKKMSSPWAWLSTTALRCTRVWRYNTAACIVTLGTKWRRVVASRLGFLSPGETDNGARWIGSWVDPRASLDAVGVRPRFLVRDVDIKCDVPRRMQVVVYCRHVSISYSRANNHIVLRQYDLYEWNNTRAKCFQKCARVSWPLNPATDVKGPYNFLWYGAETKNTEFLRVIRKGFCVWAGTK
jgi:hypothetical protein